MIVFLLTLMVSRTSSEMKLIESFMAVAFFLSLASAANCAVKTKINNMYMLLNFIYPYLKIASISIFCSISTISGMSMRNVPSSNL